MSLDITLFRPFSAASDWSPACPVLKLGDAHFESQHSGGEAKAGRPLWAPGQPCLQSQFQDNQGYTHKHTQKNPLSGVEAVSCGFAPLSSKKCNCHLMILTPSSGEAGHTQPRLSIQASDLDHAGMSIFFLCPFLLDLYFLWPNLYLFISIKFLTSTLLKFTKRKL